MTFAWATYLRAAALAVGVLAAGSARAATDIDLFFPVPVDGQLARDMATLIKQFNAAHPDIKATPVYTGSYDETLIKTRSATQAGRPPKTWDDLVVAAKKLTRREGDRVTRWGFLMPSNYDYGGWILSALTMSNGGRYFNEEYGGEIYYDTPTTVGALTVVGVS